MKSHSFSPYIETVVTAGESWTSSLDIPKQHTQISKHSKYLPLILRAFFPINSVDFKPAPFLDNTSFSVSLEEHINQKISFSQVIFLAEREHSGCKKKWRDYFDDESQRYLEVYGEV